MTPSKRTALTAVGVLALAMVGAAVVCTGVVASGLSPVGAGDHAQPGASAPLPPTSPTATAVTRTDAGEAPPDTEPDGGSNLLAGLLGLRVVRCDLQETLPGVLTVARVAPGPPERAGDLAVPAGHARPEPTWAAGKAGTALHLRVDTDATRIVVASPTAGVWEIEADAGEVGSSVPCRAARHLAAPVTVTLRPVDADGSPRVGSRVRVVGGSPRLHAVDANGEWTGEAPGWPVVARVLPDERGPEQWLLVRGPGDVTPLPAGALDGLRAAFAEADDERDAARAILADQAAEWGVAPDDVAPIPAMPPVPTPGAGEGAAGDR